MILNNLEFGTSVLVLDSNDLPEKWWEVDLRSLIPEDHPGHNTGYDAVLPQEDFLSCPDDFKPPRVVIYTTEQLLELLCFCRKANVDGTFWCCPKIFKQVYILLCEYKKTSLLCSMALLPDKKRMSYHVFILLLLLESKKRFGIEKLCLEKIKMDFELGS